MCKRTVVSTELARCRCDLIGHRTFSAASRGHDWPSLGGVKTDCHLKRIQRILKSTEDWLDFLPLMSSIVSRSE